MKNKKDCWNGGFFLKYFLDVKFEITTKFHFKVVRNRVSIIYFTILGEVEKLNFASRNLWASVI